MVVRSSSSVVVRLRPPFTVVVVCPHSPLAAVHTPQGALAPFSPSAVIRHLLPSWSGVNPPPPFGGSSSLLSSGGRPAPPLGGVLGRALGCWGVGWLDGWVVSTVV